jgi:hypothetical protein
MKGRNNDSNDKNNLGRDFYIADRYRRFIGRYR